VTADQSRDDTTRPRAPYSDVQGRCPACGSSLFLADGGHVTCALDDCPEPDAATTLLERDMRTTTPAHDRLAAWARDHALTDLDTDEAITTLFAAVQPELAELADYRNRLTWETTCGEHARLLDSCRAADERAERAETDLAAALDLYNQAEKATEAATDRAETAETALARVSQLAERWRYVQDRRAAADAIRAALAGPDATTPNGD
jgi:hypothetical protein